MDIQNTQEIHDLISNKNQAEWNVRQGHNHELPPKKITSWKRQSASFTSKTQTKTKVRFHKKKNMETELLAEIGNMSLSRETLWQFLKNSQ